ncbi:MAG: lipid II:glycine glycyltransferase FemX [Verrucomicrobiota bacterium]
MFSPLPSSNRDRTIILDLSPSLETLRKQLDQKWRNQLNRAERNGLEFSEGTNVQDFREFRELYNEMFDRKKFSTSVDVGEFEKICADLPEPFKLRILICRQGGVAVSGIVCSAMGDTGIYLLGATTSAGLQAKGAYLLQWRMIQWLKEQGFRYYDLGGIDPEKNPGVYHFKQGMSGMDITRDSPLQACENFLSSMVAKAADLSQGGFRSRMKRLVLPGLRSYLRIAGKKV